MRYYSIKELVGEMETFFASLAMKQDFSIVLEGQHYPPVGAQRNNARQQTSLQVLYVQARAPLLQKANRPLCSQSRRAALRPTASNIVAASASDAGAPTKKFMGIEAITWQKIVPLGFMFFCILFNYTILRDTKVGHSKTAHPTPLTLYCFCLYTILCAHQLLVLHNALPSMKW